MNKVTVSIIVPNFNHELYLPHRLESIFNQTFQDFELILLDDCSTDKSISILKKYKNHDKVSHLIFNQKNSGNPFEQWKKGIKLARGKYIWIAESDDWAAPTFLETLLLQFQQDEAIQLAYCQSYIVNKDHEILASNLRYTDVFSPNKWETNYIENGNTEIKNFLLYESTIPNASAVLFKNSPNLLSYVSTKLYMCGDWWFWINVIKNKKIAFEANHLNYFRTHTTTTRVFDTFAKRKQLILEKLEIIYLINILFPDFDTKLAKRRLFNAYPFPARLSRWNDFKLIYEQEMNGKISFLTYFYAKVTKDIRKILKDKKTIPNEIHG